MRRSLLALAVPAMLLPVAYAATGGVIPQAHGDAVQTGSDATTALAQVEAAWAEAIRQRELAERNARIAERERQRALAAQKEAAAQKERAEAERRRAEQAVKEAQAERDEVTAVAQQAREVAAKLRAAAGVDVDNEDGPGGTVRRPPDEHPAGVAEEMRAEDDGRHTVDEEQAGRADGAAEWRAERHEAEEAEHASAAELRDVRGAINDLRQQVERLRDDLSTLRKRLRNRKRPQGGRAVGGETRAE